MEYVVQFEFPYRWGQLVLKAGSAACLEQLQAQTLALASPVEATTEGWLAFRGEVLRVLGNLPPEVDVRLEMLAPAAQVPVATPAGVRAALEALGWSQEELARQLGVTSNTVWRWVTGRTPIPVWLHTYMALTIRQR